MSPPWCLVGDCYDLVVSQGSESEEDGDYVHDGVEEDEVRSFRKTEEHHGEVGAQHEGEDSREVGLLRYSHDVRLRRRQQVVESA